MTIEEAINDLKDFIDIYLTCHGEEDTVAVSLDNVDVEAFHMAIKALEQESSDDVMAIHTQGLDEGIRCAMCTNSMKSDSGCDGGCIVNEGMYKKVMETINNHIFSQPTSEDCVSREQALKELKESAEHHANDSREEVLLRRDRDIIKALPPVTPTRPKGHWINIDKTHSKCDKCESIFEIVSVNGEANYCPNCGAETEREE